MNVSALLARRCAGSHLTSCGCTRSENVIVGMWGANPVRPQPRVFNLNSKGLMIKAVDTFRFPKFISETCKKYFRNGQTSKTWKLWFFIFGRFRPSWPDFLLISVSAFRISIFILRTSSVLEVFLPSWSLGGIPCPAGRRVARAM